MPRARETGTPTRLVSISLADAPEGESELVLTVRDEAIRALFARSVARTARALDRAASVGSARARGTKARA